MLPLTYEPELITEYWMRRPVSVVGRVLQLLGVSVGPTDQSAMLARP